MNGQDSLYQEQVSYEEPETHTKQKGFLEKLFACFSQGHDLSQAQIKVFSELKHSAKEGFSANDEEPHKIKLLKNLWISLTGEQDMQQVNSEEWIKYGFQQKNPRTDFRGGKLISLRHLENFVRENNSTFLEMIEEKNQFFMAISSIQLTHFLLKYFHLTSELTYPRNKAELCTRPTLHSFCCFLERDPNSLTVLHNYLFGELFESWKLYQIKNSAANIMDFDKCFQAFKKKFEKIMQSNYFHRIEDLQVQFKLMKK